MIASINRAFHRARNALNASAFIMEAVLDVEEVVPGSEEEFEDVTDVDSVPADAYKRVDELLDKIVDSEDYDDTEADEMLDDIDEDEISDEELDAIMEAAICGDTSILDRMIGAMNENLAHMVQTAYNHNKGKKMHASGQAKMDAAREGHAKYREWKRQEIESDVAAHAARKENFYGTHPKGNRIRRYNRSHPGIDRRALGREIDQSNYELRKKRATEYMAGLRERNQGRQLMNQDVSPELEDLYEAILADQIQLDSDPIWESVCQIYQENGIMMESSIGYQTDLQQDMLDRNNTPRPMPGASPADDEQDFDYNDYGE